MKLNLGKTGSEYEKEKVDPIANFPGSDHQFSESGQTSDSRVIWMNSVVGVADG